MIMETQDSLLRDISETNSPSQPRSLSRRQFALTGAAAATALAIAPRHVLGRTSKPDPRALVETHPAVEGEDLSQEYTVTVNGLAVPVYTAKLMPQYNDNSAPQWDPSHTYIYNGKSNPPWDPAYSFASFEFSGRVTVTISSSKPLTALFIRPSTPAIHAKLKGNTATFTLTQPGNFAIERNGNGRKDPLLLFANPIESERPREGDPNVIYYGPGRHNAGMIHLTSNQTLYIAGGAVVTGAVVAQGDNIKIIGRGLLENAGAEYKGKNMILLKQCTRARIEGIIIRKDSREWTVVQRDCDGVTLANIKLCCSYSFNDDGLDMVNSRNMTIEDCFIRTNDDCLAFKGMESADGNCENITVRRCCLWGDGCGILAFGDECRAAYMRNITIEDCHVLYLSFEGNPKKFLLMHAGEDMWMENIRMENIDIHGEGQNRNLITIDCEINRFNKKKVPGHIRNILLKNVKLTGKDGPYQIVIKGYSDQYPVDGVTFQHCKINGRPITADSPNVHIGEFTKNIKFIT